MAAEKMYWCDGHECYDEQKRYPLNQLTIVWFGGASERYCSKCINLVNTFATCCLCLKKCKFGDGYIKYTEVEHYCTNCLVSPYIFSENERCNVPEYHKIVTSFQSGDRNSETTNIIDYLIQKAKERCEQLKKISKNVKKDCIFEYFTRRFEFGIEDAIFIVNSIPEYKLDEIYAQRLDGKINSRKFILSLLK
jgi:hypothetical protein